MSTRTALSAMALLIAALLPAAAASQATHERISAAGAELLAGLGEERRGEASYAFDDGERFDLRLAPLLLEGAELRDMDVAEEAKVRALLAAALSPTGRAKVETIMSLERELAELEGRSFGLGWFRQFGRDPRGYFISVFGDPGAGGPWGFRFDGHHVSLNYTLAPGQVPSASPLFLGAQPDRVPDGMERAGLRALAQEEDLARALLRALASQRDAATIPFRSGRALFLGEGRRVELEGPAAGLARGSMSSDARGLLDALIDVYLANVPDEVAAAQRAAIDAAGRDQVHFAWAGGEAPGEPHYYRIRGPTILIELDNSLDPPDHVHAIWRDLDGDFGEDLLAGHYARAH